jgi:crotonobetaine/carnitine-CoA ligase
MIDVPKSLWTYPAALRRQAEQFGDRVFATFPEGGQLTFREWQDQSDVLASALARMHVGPGDRVVAFLFNTKEFLLLMLATHKRGGIFVPINTELRGTFLRHQLEVTEPKVVFVDQSLGSALSSAEIEDNRYSVVVAGPMADQPDAFSRLLQSDALPEDIVPASPYDVCTIMFTSGTTGPAKGVQMTHAHCFYNGWIAGDRTGLADTDCMYIAMPLFHGTASLLQLYASLIVGARAHIVKRFSASNWLSDIRNCGATVTYAAGVMPEFILAQPEHNDRDNPLRLVWAVPVSAEWGGLFQERFGVELLQAYGMSELCVPVWGKRGEPLEPGCAGYVVDEFFEIRIVDPETDEALPAGQVGEIVGRPKHPGVFMAGYFRMPEKTVEACRNLWFHTGDAGCLDERGRLYYVDRIRDRIRRRGENISAFEVEQAISSHPEVLQCAVVGVKVEGAGGEDEVLAQVVLRTGNLGHLELLQWCVKKMPRYAVPRFIEFVDEIEQTSTGKVRKQAIRDKGVTSRTWDRESVGFVVPR